MKLSENKENIATINNTSGEITSFKMKNNAKAFSILSSGIYANKIKAIIRELSCNAYDSHVEAGKKDIPFEVHLPTYFEPYFYVRDYGTGLTHQQVFDVYTTYFDSTKTNSNDYIGALGLGSKSPFSYTNNFTITAIKDGRKGIYSAFINDDGFPSVVLMADEKTDETNGVEVRFAVENGQHFLKFIKEAEDVFQHFQLKPVISGEENITIPEKKYAYKNISENVNLLEEKKYGDSKSHAIMGNICYPIDYKSLINHIDDSTKLEYLKYRLEFYFDIGEVEFQTSREGLSYNSKTVKSIEKKLNELDESLYKTVKETLDSYDNIWEKTQKGYEFQKMNRIFIVPVEKYMKNLAYETNNNNKQISIVSYYSHYYDMCINSEILEKCNIKIRGFGESRGIYNEPNSFSSYLPEFNTLRNIISIIISEKTFFVINEKKSGAITRAKYNFDKSNANTLFVLEKGEDNRDPDFEEFFKFIFNPPKEQIFHVSELNKIPSKKKESIPSSVLSINFNHRHNNSYTEPEYIWEETIVNFDDTTTKHFYIPLSGYDSICDDNSKKIKDIKGFYSFLVKQKLFDKLGIENKIYGIRKKDFHLIKDKDNWIDIQEHMASLSPELIKDIYYGYLLHMQKDNQINVLIDMKSEIMQNIKDKNSYFTKSMDIIEKYKDYRSNTNPQHKLNFENYLFVDYHLGEQKKNALKNEAENLMLTLYEKYPMIFHMSTNWYIKTKDEEKVIKDIVNYINIMDSIKGEN